MEISPCIVQNVGASLALSCICREAGWGRTGSSGCQAMQARVTAHDGAVCTPVCPWSSV